MSDKAHKPYVPDDSTMSEFTWRALLLGLVMCVILGAANAYLGLRAGMTIAATYPAAVIGMAVLRLMKGSLLEENFARTVGSIGESVAAGAIFTIPAFVILQIWTFKSFDLTEYLTASALMIVGGILGVLFVTVLRRVMVEDQSLPYPESVAAAEIHKAGQRGADAAMRLFSAMGVGAVVKLLGDAGVFSASNTFTLAVGRLKESFVRLGLKSDAPTIAGGRRDDVPGARREPGLPRRRLHHRPRARLAELRGRAHVAGACSSRCSSSSSARSSRPRTRPRTAASAGRRWPATCGASWCGRSRSGGMLVGASFTLFRMRKNLASGIKRGIADLQKSAAAKAATERTERDLSFKTVLAGIGVVFVLMIALYFYFTKVLPGAFFAAIVMLVTGFFFAAVSGNLVGLIGSSNNPISGLTLATTIVAALTMVIVGVKGMRGRRRRARRGGGRVRLVRRRGRDAPGPEGGPHPRRHAVEDAGRRPDRRRGRGARALLPALPAAHGRPRRRTRRPAASAARASRRRRPA